MMTEVEFREVELTREVGQVPQKSLRRPGLRYDALLVLVTMIWGGTFLVVKDTVKLRFYSCRDDCGQIALCEIEKSLIRRTEF